MSVNGETTRYHPSTAGSSPLPWQVHPVNESNHGNPAKPTILKLPYEILEKILLELPVQDLLLSQRICHSFKDMVASSKPIRRALFLEPVHHNGQIDSWRLLRFNPFLTDQLAGSFHTRVIGVHRGQEGTVKMVAHVRYEKEALLDDKWAEILLYENASWKSMLVSQPPATLLMHPGASLFWKTALEQTAQFYEDNAGFTIMDVLECSDW